MKPIIHTRNLYVAILWYLLLPTFLIKHIKSGELPREDLNNRQRDAASERSGRIIQDAATTYNNKACSTTKSYEKCGFTSNVKFATWFGTLFTDSPVLYPVNDTQLASIVTTAAAAGCKVRVRGNGHSEDGIVMQKTDEIDYNVVVLNLKYYIPDDPTWHRVINTTRPSVKMSAGNNQIDLMGFVRPQSWLPATGTIGRLFQLGGVYMNPSTFGGWFEEPRLASHVLSVRIMHANGTIAVYEGDDVLPWRGSMGLMGITTALEILLRPDIGLKMTKKVLDMQLANPPYSTSKVLDFVNEIVTNNDGCNFFYYARIDIMFAQVFDYDGDKSYNASATQGWYDEQISNPINDTRVDYPDPFLNSIIQLSAVPDGWGEKFGKLVQYRTYILSTRRFDEQKVMPKDGYANSPEIPNYEQLAYFIKCSSYRCVDDITKWIDITRTYLKTKNYQNPNSRFGDVHMFWRVFSVREGERLLEHAPEPGYYIGVEIQSMKLIKQRVMYSYHFKNLEELWHKEFPVGFFHHGKAYAYGPLDGKDLSNEYIPFQNDTMVNTMYSPAVRTAFIEQMNKYDPAGVFRAGSALRMLGLTNRKYTLRQSDGDTCYRRSNSGCLSTCCDKPTSASSLLFRSPRTAAYCRPRGNYSSGAACTTSCDCSMGAFCYRSIFTALVAQCTEWD